SWPLLRLRARLVRSLVLSVVLSFFLHATAPADIYTLSLHDALPISGDGPAKPAHVAAKASQRARRLSRHPPRTRRKPTSPPRRRRLDDRRDPERLGADAETSRGKLVRRGLRGGGVTPTGFLPQG